MTSYVKLILCNLSHSNSFKVFNFRSYGHAKKIKLVTFPKTFLLVKSNGHCCWNTASIHVCCKTTAFNTPTYRWCFVFNFLQEHGCVSVIFVTDEKNMFHSPAIRQLVTRSGQEVPPLLEAMADLAIQASQLKVFRFPGRKNLKNSIVR